MREEGKGEGKGVRYPFFFRRNAVGFGHGGKGGQVPFLFQEKRGRIRSWVESGDWRLARWFTTR